MKYIICLMLAIIVGGRIQAQDFHDWKVSFKITDESGQPIQGAEATVFYDRMAMPDNSIDPGKIIGLTDANGAFIASHHDRTYGLRFRVQKDGYYSTDIEEDFHRVFSPEKLNRNLNLVLKKIGKPIGMYAKYIISIEFPTFNKPIGYDLMIGDWVAPYGKGISSDFLFTENHPDAKSGYTFTISFPKPGDGIQEFKTPDEEKGSGLRSPHEASVDGYQPKYEQVQMPDPNKNYFFRVRTVLDVNGNVVSAHYGKIYGDFMQFTYYLNPTPNDRNIEFDPKQNLLGGDQRVQSP